MPAPDAFMKTGDLLPELAATLEDADGNPVDLSGATVAFTMRLVGSTTPLIDASSATFVSSAAGTVKYSWVSGNTAVAGDYDCEFRATFSGKPYTFPSDRYLWLQIKGRLAT